MWFSWLLCTLCALIINLHVQKRLLIFEYLRYTSSFRCVGLFQSDIHHFCMICLINPKGVGDNMDHENKKPLLAENAASKRWRNHKTASTKISLFF